MKKAMAIILSLCVILAISACGDKQDGGETDSGRTQSQKELQGRVADKYHKLLEGDNTVYYYEANVSEQMDEDSEPMECVKAEGRNAEGVLAVATGDSEPDLREIETKDAYYTVDDQQKAYARDELEDVGEEIELEYAQTSEMELDGKILKYDEYLDEYEMAGFGEDGETIESDTYLYKKRYLVDDKGDLYAIVIIQEQKGKNGGKNQLIYQEIDTITKLEDKNVPEAFFEIPDDYKEVESLDE